MKKHIIFLLMILISSANLFPQSTETEIENRIQLLFKQLTLEEKIDLLSGTGFETKPIERLENPSLKMADVSLRVRRNKATAFPSAILMAATFISDLQKRFNPARKTGTIDNQNFKSE